METPSTSIDTFAYERVFVLATLFAPLNDRDQHRTEPSNPWPSSAIICTDHSIYRRTYYFRSKWIMARITVVLRVYSHEVCACVWNATIIVVAVTCWYFCAKNLECASRINRNYVHVSCYGFCIADTSTQRHPPIHLIMKWNLPSNSGRTWL